MDAYQHLIERIRRNSRPLETDPTGLIPAAGICREIRSIIFDVYGTLFISSSGDIGTSKQNAEEILFAEAFKNTQIPLLHSDSPGTARNLYFSAIEEHHRMENERGNQFPEVDILQIWEKTVSFLFQNKHISFLPSPDKLADLSIEYETLSNNVWPMPGGKELLLEISNSDILPGIISNAQFYTPLLFPALMGLTLEDSGIDESCCIWSYQMGKAKPSEELFTSLFSRLKAHLPLLKREEILYVGNDMLNDIWAANSAGFSTALFAGDTKSLRLRERDPRCSNIKPDFVVTRLSQLSFILGFSKPKEAEL